MAAKEERGMAARGAKWEEWRTLANPRHLTKLTGGENTLEARETGEGVEGSQCSTSECDS